MIWARGDLGPVAEHDAGHDLRQLVFALQSTPVTISEGSALLSRHPRWTIPSAQPRPHGSMPSRASSPPFRVTDWDAEFSPASSICRLRSNATSPNTTKSQDPSSAPNPLPPSLTRLIEPLNQLSASVHSRRNASAGRLEWPSFLSGAPIGPLGCRGSLSRRKRLRSSLGKLMAEHATSVGATLNTAHPPPVASTALMRPIPKL